MAFSSTFDRPGPAHAGGNLRIYTGTWSAAAGDADGTITVTGGSIRLAQFKNLDGTTPAEQDVPVTISAASGVVTITVKAHQTVTSGIFTIIAK
jgi:phage tail sheath gpL-like